MSPERLFAKLAASWSAETATTWTAENPARGQCSVSALVVQDVLGGHLLKTRIDGAWHFYNRVSGRRIDVAVSQFSAPICYDDVPTSREDAFADTSDAQYRLLRARVLGS